MAGKINLHNVEQQAHGGNSPRPENATQRQEEQVGNDDQQGWHADDELHQHGGCITEMSLDNAQCGGDGGTSHHGEQRHR